MPPPSSRMTKQPERPRRYFPGKALAPDSASEDESEEEDKAEDSQPIPAKAPAPEVTSFPRHIKPAASTLPTASKKPPPEQIDDLEDFVTASESSSGDDGAGDSGSDDDETSGSSEEEEGGNSSSSDEPKKPMLAPKFISKAKRLQQETGTNSIEDASAEEARRKQEKADAILQAQLERDAAARAAGKKAWDDDDIAAEDEIDDTDDVDQEAERAAWKLRELRRVQRDRLAIVEKEKDREEIERRRNMTVEEREKEDQEFIEKQQEERDGRGKMAYMQKYFHKGAFFQGDNDEQDEEVKQALERDMAGAKFVDDAGDKAVLPEYMRIRDMTRLGKKGRTKYRDLKSEDTGRWGRMEGKRRDEDGLDERFRSDDWNQGGIERTGANNAPLRDRRRKLDDHSEVDRDREDKRPRFD